MAHIQSVHFFDNIERQYGADLRTSFKEYANNTRKLGNMTSRKSFLVRCRRRGVFPTHISNNFRFTFPLLEEYSPYANKVQKSITKFMKSILNIEIQHTYYKIKILKARIASLGQRIQEAGIPEETTTSFFESQARYNERNTTIRRNRTMRKFERIMEQTRESTSEQIPTVISKAIHNGTQATIPPETETLLSLGPKFALPHAEADPVFYYHLLADVECILKTEKEVAVRGSQRDPESSSPQQKPEQPP